MGDIFRCWYVKYTLAVIWHLNTFSNAKEKSQNLFELGNLFALYHRGFLSMVSISCLSKCYFKVTVFQLENANGKRSAIPTNDNLPLHEMAYCKCW